MVLLHRFDDPDRVGQLQDALLVAGVAEADHAKRSRLILRGGGCMAEFRRVRDRPDLHGQGGQPFQLLRETGAVRRQAHPAAGSQALQKRERLASDRPHIELGLIPQQKHDGRSIRAFVVLCEPRPTEQLLGRDHVAEHDAAVIEAKPLGRQQELVAKLIVGGGLGRGLIG